MKKTALVTGSGKRIGRAVAHALSRAGYAVVVHARQAQEGAPEVVRELKELGGMADCVFADLADAEAPARMVDAAGELFGPLTLLVNNASEFKADALGELDVRQWDRHFAINLRAPIFLAQSFARQAPADADPCIVNITDQRVLKPVPNQFSYTVTKCALSAATTLLAQALAPAVRVNAVAPGPTLPSPRQDAAQFEKQVQALPLQRGPSPEDIAEAVVFLARAKVVTGTTIAVDGGQHIAWQTRDVTSVQE